MNAKALGSPYLKGPLRRSAVLFLFLMLRSLTANPQQEPSREYQIKAVFLFNFTQFVEWPPHAFESPDSPMVIGILGNDPFGVYLDETIKGDSVNGHPLQVKRYKTAAEIGTCHVLYINPGPKGSVKALIDQLGQRSILTVSDAENFALLGGVIRLYTKDRKTRLRINLEAAKKSELVISSKLLRLAEILE